MAINDVYFKIGGFNKILAKSTQDTSDKEGKETKTSKLTLTNLSVNDTIVISFDTLDSQANNGLQGEFIFSSNSFIEFQDVESGLISNTHLLPDEPTVQGDETAQIKQIKLISSLDEADNRNDNITVVIDFSGTVEILDPGFDVYSVIDCCPCNFLPFIDERNCEEYCICPEPPECDNDTKCPCNFYCDTSFFEGDQFTNGEGNCLFGCNTVADCCELTEEEIEDGFFMSCKEDGQGNRKCTKDKEPTDDEEPEQGLCCDEQNPRPCPEGKVCIDCQCEDEEPFEFNRSYIFIQKISFAHTKTGHDFDFIRSRDGMENHTDQTLVYKTCKTIDKDEGGTGRSLAIYNDYGRPIPPFAIRNVDNNQGIVSHFETFGSVFASMRGTNFQSDGILDSIEFSNPLRSSDLKTKLSVGLRGTSFVRERVPPGDLILVGNALKEFGFTEFGERITDGLFNVASNEIDHIESSFGVNGKQEKVRFFFAKIVEASSASSPDFASAEQKGEPVQVTINRSFDTISLSEKDSYVPGRVTNENFVSAGSATKQFPYLTQPFATKIVNKVFTSNSGTKFIKQIREKLLITEIEELSTVDYDTAIRINIGGSFSSPRKSAWNPIFMFSNNEDLPFIPNVDDPDDPDDPNEGFIDPDDPQPTDEGNEENAREEEESSTDPCPEAFQLPNSVDAI